MNKILSIITFITVISIVFTACKKDTELTEQKVTDPTEQKILDFKAKLETPNKSNDPMSVEDAVWYIEAALNYTNCVVSEDLVGDGLGFNSDFEELSFEINVNDGMIDFSDVTEYYFTLESQMIDLLDTYENDIIFVNTVDVDIQENILTAYFFIKYKDTEKAFWDISGDWEWGMEFGRCDYPQAGDLTYEINTWLSRNRAVRYNVYYTDITTYPYDFFYIPDNEEPYVDISPDINIKYHGGEFFHEYYVRGESNSWHFCVDEQDCNDWAYCTNQTFDIIENTFISSNRDITSWIPYEHIHHEVDGIYPNADYHHWTSHMYRIKSGIYHSKGGSAQ